MEAPLVLDSSKLNVSFQQKPPRLVRWGFHPSPFDPVVIGLTEDGAICRFEFSKKRRPDAILKAMQKEWPQTKFVRDQDATAKVMQGIMKHRVPKILMNGTKFQQNVWKTMLSIPVGKVLTYAEVAKRIKNPKAVRAVGTACGANPVAILVPCHRIIGSNGGLGGFGGGLPLKRALLEAEGVLDKAA